MVDFLNNTHFISCGMEMIPHKSIKQNIKNSKENTVFVLKGPSLPSVWQAIPVLYRTELCN